MVLATALHTNLKQKNVLSIDRAEALASCGAAEFVQKRESVVWA